MIDQAAKQISSELKEQYSPVEWKIDCRNERPGSSIILLALTGKPWEMFPCIPIPQLNRDIDLTIECDENTGQPNPGSPDL